MREGYILSILKTPIDTPIPIPKVIPPRTIKSDLKSQPPVRWLKSWRVLPAGDYHPTWMVVANMHALFYEVVHNGKVGASRIFSLIPPKGFDLADHVILIKSLTD